jgi:hypothetical protein
MALDDISARRGDALTSIVANLRAPEPGMTGRWLYARNLFEKAKRRPTQQRVCVERTTTRSGASRCARYESRPIAATEEIQIAAAPSADEAKDLRALAPVVEAKGAVPDAATNGRYGLLVQRLAQDVRLYLGQGPHPALCSGGAEITEFLLAQYAPLKKREDELTDRARRTRAAAIARTRAVGLAETAAYNAAIAEAEAARRAARAEAARRDVAKAETEGREVASPAPADATAVAAPPKPPQATIAAEAALPQLLTEPPPVRSLEDLAARSIPALVLEATRPLLPPAAITEIAGASNPISSLARARSAIIAAQTNGSLNAPKPVRDAAVEALRALEAAAYADLAKSRYAPLDATIRATLTEIATTHARTCTCDN